MGEGGKEQPPPPEPRLNTGRSREPGGDFSNYGFYVFWHFLGPTQVVLCLRAHRAPKYLSYLSKNRHGGAPPTPLVGSKSPRKRGENPSGWTGGTWSGNASPDCRPHTAIAIPTGHSMQRFRRMSRMANRIKKKKTWYISPAHATRRALHMGHGLAGLGNRTPPPQKQIENIMSQAKVSILYSET